MRLGPHPDHGIAEQSENYLYSTNHQVVNQSELPAWKEEHNTSHRNVAHVGGAFARIKT